MWGTYFEDLDLALTCDAPPGHPEEDLGRVVPPPPPLRAAV